MVDLRACNQANSLAQEAYPLNQDRFHTDTNNDICDVVGCSTKWTEEIWVPDGSFGNIKLSLCSNCTSKFSNVSKEGILVPVDNLEEFGCQ